VYFVFLPVYFKIIRLLIIGSKYYYEKTIFNDTRLPVSKGKFAGLVVAAKKVITGVLVALRERLQEIQIVLFARSAVD
jgi:hypothetical protein